MKRVYGGIFYVKRPDSGVGGMTPERMMQEIDLLRRIRSKHLWCSPNESQETIVRLRENSLTAKSGSSCDELAVRSAEERSTKDIERK